MPHHDMGVAPEFQATLKEIERQTGIRQAILSNCGETRFGELGRIFPELPVLKAYVAADGQTFLRSGHRGVEAWSDRAGGTVDDISSYRQHLRPLKKPSAELIEFALHQLGSPPRDHVFMVGDQYFTDIAGANLAGIRSVKVPTFRPESFPFAVRTFQKLERLIYRVLF
ncbi:MAG: HAD hydrolase-like protein [Gemmatimonadota bacterium]